MPMSHNFIFVFSRVLTFMRGSKLSDHVVCVDTNSFESGLKQIFFLDFLESRLSKISTLKPVTHFAIITITMITIKFY